MKPKRNYKTSKTKPAALDLCQTPPWAVAPLIPYISEIIPHGKVRGKIWEPACGQGILANALRVAGFDVIETDLALGQDFFEYEPPEWDMIVTNPPYGIKPAWVERCYDLKKPFSLLMPTEFQSTEGGAEQFWKYGIGLLDIYPRVCFKMLNDGWFSDAQFPTSWYCHDIFGVELIWEKIYPPTRTESRWVWKKVKGELKYVQEHGFGNWVEKPEKFQYSPPKFLYPEILSTYDIGAGK